MHVVHLIESLGAGGAERSLAELLPGLRDAGVASTVVCLVERSVGFEREVFDAGFDVRHIAPAGPVGRVLAVRRLLRTERPDILHTTLVRADICGRIAAAGTGVPVVTSLVGASYEPDRRAGTDLRRRKVALWRLADSVTARRVERFHAVSEAVKASAVRRLHLDPARITVIPRGRDAGRLGEASPERRAAARDRLGVGAGDWVVVSVGRHEPDKGHVTLLEAVPQIVARVPNTLVVVAGRPGRSTPDLERLLAVPATAAHVRLLGHRDDIPDVLAAADVFVLPSISEGFPGAMIEAMALSLPIVATDLPAVREIVDDGVDADIVPVRSPGALAEAVASLLVDGERAAAYGSENRRRFLERHSLARSVADLAALYRSVILERAARS